MTKDLYTEIIKSEPIMTNLTEGQLSDLIEAYANQIVDGMDMKTMEQFVFDVITDSFVGKDEKEVIEELRCFLDDEDVAQMLSDVGADPDTLI
jgi:hypothetical protein